MSCSDFFSRKKMLFISLLFFFLLGKAHPAYAQTPASRYDNDVMVILKEKPSTKVLISLSDKLSTQEGELKGGVPNSNIVVYQVGSDPAAAAKHLQADSNVKFAFPMPKVHAQKTTNDSLYGSQWYLQSVKVAGSSTSAWDLISDLSGTSGVKVAVIDTGVDKTHPDLTGKIDDGDWIICDYNHTPQCYADANGVDDNGHGTHVAGLIAATPNNNVGIAGTGWGVKILSIKALDADGSGSLMDVFLSAQYAVDHGARIINLSLGATESSLGTSGVEAVQEYVDGIWNLGGLMVVAAGNCGGGGDANCGGTNPKMYPAASNHVLSVGAIRQDNTLASYSENGDWVTVLAPGGSCEASANQTECILSTWSSTGGNCPVSGSASGYCYDQGTSMSAPQVAGIAALMLAKNSSLTNSQLLEIIGSTADSSVASGKSLYGLVNAKAALEAVAVLPSPTLTGTVSKTPTPSPTGSSASPTPGISMTPTVTPFPTDIPRLPKSQSVIPSPPLCVHSCALSEKGDANCDGQINASDIDAWARHFDTILPGNTQLANANFACVEGNANSSYIDLIDFELWRRNTTNYGGN